MTDRELIERAAKAAGIEHDGEFDDNDTPSAWIDRTAGIRWNPLTDDRDAFLLAIKLRLDIDIMDDPFQVAAKLWTGETGDELVYAAEAGPDEAAATRRAIVRAAAAR